MVPKCAICRAGERRAATVAGGSEAGPDDSPSWPADQPDLPRPGPAAALLQVMDDAEWSELERWDVRSVQDQVRKTSGRLE